MARIYQKTQALLPQIQQMLEEVLTQREIASALGPKSKETVHNLLTRERKKAVQGVPKARSRKPAKSGSRQKQEWHR